MKKFHSNEPTTEEKSAREDWWICYYPLWINFDPTAVVAPPPPSSQSTTATAMRLNEITQWKMLENISRRKKKLFLFIASLKEHSKYAALTKPKRVHFNDKHKVEVWHKLHPINNAKCNVTWNSNDHWTKENCKKNVYYPSTTDFKFFIFHQTQ